MDEEDFEMIGEEGLELRNKRITKWRIIYVKKDDIYLNNNEYFAMNLHSKHFKVPMDMWTCII